MKGFHAAAECRQPLIGGAGMNRIRDNGVRTYLLNGHDALIVSVA